MTEERRKTPRIRVYLPLRMSQGEMSQVIETLTKDLGSAGLRCLSQNACPVSTQMRLELILSASQEPLSVRGRVVWFRTIPQSDQFDLGIAFLEMPAQDERRLSGYLSILPEQANRIPA